MNVFKISTIVICLFILFACKENNFETKSETNSEIVPPLTFQGEVVAIKDGDTYEVLNNGKAQTIRLAHIDCPEKKQAFGSKAKMFASNLCFGKIVIVSSEGKMDRYKRLIAEVLLQDGTNVNQELVKNGLAWHFKKYSDSKEYAELEIQARNNKVGLWRESNPIAPWDWRRK
ncbi:MAG: thermonuclease family protein [Chitinophagaceae bacterium]